MTMCVIVVSAIKIKSLEVVLHRTQKFRFVTIFGWHCVEIRRNIFFRVSSKTTKQWI